MAAAATAAASATEIISKGSPQFKALVKTFRFYKRPSRVEQHVRKAIEQGKLGLILSCVQESKTSTLTLRSPGVMKHTIRGLRADPQLTEWNELAVSKALKRSRVLAALMDTEDHGFGKRLQPDDPRRQPEVLGTFLELAAVNAFKHNDKQDVDGKVKVFAARLLSCIEAKPEFLQEKEWKVPEHGQVDVVLDSVPTWHGLSLAQSILGKNMPQNELASRVVASLHAGLKQVTDEIRAKDPADGTYGAEALRTFDGCIEP